MSYDFCRLDEVAEVIDSLHKTPSYVEVGYPMVRVTDVKYGPLLLENTFRVDEKTFGEFTRKYKPNQGDIVVTRVGSYGLFGKVVDSKFCLGQNTAAIVPKKISSEYLYAILNSSQIKSQIEEVVVGSTQKTLSLKAIKELKIPRLDGKLEMIISQFSAVLDAKIDLLQETNQTLEAMAQAIFKSWFVDFEPVRAKAEGKVPEGIDAETAALFPDAFEETEFGLSPKGWGVKKFGDFIQRHSVGKKFDQKTALTEGAIPILDQGKSGVIGFHNESAGVKASLENPVVVFSNHTCYMRLICFDFSAIQNVLPFTGKQVDTIWAYYATRDRIKFSEYKGHWPDFAIEKAVVPPEILTKLYKDAVSPLVHRIRFNELQANTLSNLRDTLLPRLISGQLRIADAEKELEEATA